VLSPDDAELVAREDRIQALAELLDPDRLRERLAAAASPVWGALGAVRVDYLRYKQGTSLVAGLVADTEAGERRAYAVAGAAPLADKLAKPLARPVRPGDFAPRLGDDLLLVAPLGLDRALRPGRQVMRAPGDVVPGAVLAVVLRYKPARRLVARLDGRQGPLAVAKVHAAGEMAPAAAAARSWSGLGVDLPPVFPSPGPHVAVVGYLEGQQPADGTDPAVLGCVGEVLAKVHAAPPFPEAPETDRSRSAVAAVRAIEAVLPEAQPLAAKAAQAAEEQLVQSAGQPTLSVVHGDLSVDQVLWRPRGVALLDLDRARVDRPAADAASWFAGEAVARRCDPGADPSAVLGPMLQSYAAVDGRALEVALRPLAALALLQRATEPFRLRDPVAGWAEQVRLLVEGAAVQAGVR
jgi:hypothetical protein